MNKVLNEGNRNIKPEQGSNYFKFYVGVGNNHPTIRQIIKRRSWWHRQKTERFIGQGAVDDEEDECDEERANGTNLRGAHFIWTQWRKTELSEHLKLNNKATLMYNRLEDNYHLANKKALFMNVVNYYKAMNHNPFEVAIPLTFHIKSQNDPEYNRFEKMFHKLGADRKCQNIWIIKPGENSNRGVGI